jgi:uncharacterized protein (DUF169 family)
MDQKQLDKLTGFLEILGIDEDPMGIFYTDQKPEEGFSPSEGQLPTREKEIKNEINWEEVFSKFSCAMGHVWRARKKKTVAWFDANHFGCPGAAFWFGFLKPQSETIIHYVSSGIPGHLEGEFYCSSPDNLRRIFDDIDPIPAPAQYCVIKPVSLFLNHETPEIISFFARPESICGLHQLATFMTNDPEIVASPWGAACGNMVIWPLKYLARGQDRPVLGGWDPSARKFFKPDELSFTVSYAMFSGMLESYDQSFLSTKTWKNVQKKIELSRKKWSK